MNMGEHRRIQTISPAFNSRAFPEKHQKFHAFKELDVKK
jgi:hypothetical protein